MSRWYRFLYSIGITPWEEDAEAVAPQFESLVELEEKARESPYGRALDLGCGSGRWSVTLAQRGWKVTGVDVVPKAIQTARKRAQAAEIDVEFVTGDVSDLRAAGVSSGFSFVLDVECFNHLNDSQRVAMGREVNAVTTEDATMLLLVWTRARRGPLPPGADPEDLEMAFPGWRIAGKYPYEAELPLPLRRVSPTWYRLARV